MTRYIFGYAPETEEEIILAKVYAMLVHLTDTLPDQEYWARFWAFVAPGAAVPKKPEIIFVGRRDQLIWPLPR